mmetsp:Transcript_5743/g.10953  ORF Transcript_5743/g.10953 Transcript_5743/m.10953 type:complete len:248 (-) Transcript_5743:377-1120(-)
MGSVGGMRRPARIHVRVYHATSVSARTIAIILIILVVITVPSTSAVAAGNLAVVDSMIMTRVSFMHPTEVASIIPSLWTSPHSPPHISSTIGLSSSKWPSICRSNSRSSVSIKRLVITIIFIVKIFHTISAAIIWSIPSLLLRILLQFLTIIIHFVSRRACRIANTADSFVHITNVIIIIIVVAGLRTTLMSLIYIKKFIHITHENWKRTCSVLPHNFTTQYTEHWPISNDIEHITTNRNNVTLLDG